MVTIKLPSMLTILIGALILFLVSVLVFTLIAKNRDKRIEEHEQYIDALNNDIEIRENFLDELDRKIESRTINHTYSLSNVEISVLDIYEQSNIRIPADIIEELSNMKLATEKEVMEYIENQRLYWKLESTKKPYKGAKAL